MKTMEETKALSPLSLCAFLPLLLAACGDYSNRDLAQDLAFVQAIPDRAVLDLRVADSSPRQASEGESSQALGSLEQAVLGEPAVYYLYSASMSSSVNQSVFGFLDVVDWITREIPPTLREEGRRVWGPWQSEDSANTDFRFVMTREAGMPLFSFFYQVRDAAAREELPFEEGWQDCVFGQVEPSAGELRRGVGNMTIDLDACARFSGSGEGGLASVGFDTRPDMSDPDGKTQLQIVFADFLTKEQVEEGEAPINATYEYEESEQKRLFDFVAATDVAGNGAMEQVRLLARWTADGRGRADAEISGGDLAPAVVSLSECWDEDRARVYYEDSHGLAETEGSEQSCPSEQEL